MIEKVHLSGASLLNDEPDRLQSRPVQKPSSSLPTPPIIIIIRPSESTKSKGPDQKTSGHYTAPANLEDHPCLPPSVVKPK